jgi:phosphatidylglycerol:prolipoprotein diacylglycerol transferase
VHPRLLVTPWLTVPTFGVILACAYLAAYAWLVRGARQSHVDEHVVMDLGLWAILGALLGARALLLMRSFSDYARNPAEFWSLLTSAGDFYGGFIGGLGAAALFLVRHRSMSFWRVGDLAAPAIALGQAIGRIGCFMAGDDYGRPTDVPWAVTFTDPDAARIGGAPLGVSLHPVQLYESAFCFVLFGTLVWLRRRPHREGTILTVYTALYGSGRFLLEFLRGDEDRGFVGVLSTSQFIAVILLALTAMVWLRQGLRSIHR